MLALPFSVKKKKKKVYVSKINKKLKIYEADKLSWLPADQ